MDIGGKELARIPHLDTVNGVSFSEDGKYLATASSTLLQIWEIGKVQLIKSDELIPAACSRLFENFDPAQWSTFFGNEKYKTLCDSFARYLNKSLMKIRTDWKVLLDCVLSIGSVKERKWTQLEACIM
jgi:WD40 repeat protein